MDKHSTIAAVVTTALTVTLAGIFSLYKLEALAVSCMVVMLISAFMQAFLLVMMWAVFIEVCLRQLLEGLHVIKHAPHKVQPAMPRRVPHFC